MTSTHPHIQAILQLIGDQASKGDADGVARSVKYLQLTMDQLAAAGKSDYAPQIDDDLDDEEIDELDEEEADMLGGALLNGDTDALITALARALMIAAKLARLPSLSAVAHSVWVDE